MNRILLIAICLMASLTLRAQKLELSVQANSGVSFFRGDGTESVSFINEGSNVSQNYTNNPYGNIQAATYGIAADFKVVTKINFLFGAQLGYEVLRQKINLYRADHYYYIASASSSSFVANYTPQPISGETILTNNFIYVNPYVGYRVNINKVAIDLMPGLEIAHNTGSKEKGSTMSTENKAVTTDYKRPTPSSITRYRFDIKGSYKNWGIFAGYSRGLTDYTDKLLYATYNGTSVHTSVYDNVIRMGLSYRVH